MLAIVAAGTVKSRIPSAFAESVHRSADSLTPFSGRPARTPASFPNSSDPGASRAPVSIAPLVSEMTRVNARPIRPPAPATIKRMSDMFQTSPLPYSRGRQFGQPTTLPDLRLRPVIAFDDEEVALRMRRTDCNKPRIFGRIVAGERGLVVLEFQHHVSRARRTLLGDMPAAADQKPRTELIEHRAVLGDVFLVTLRVVNIDARDPVAFGHPLSPVWFQAKARAISSCTASAAAFGSAASITGRPITR